MSVDTYALAGVMIGDVPGDVAAVRAVVDSWRAGSRTTSEAHALIDSSRGRAPSWNGRAAEAFSVSAGELAGDVRGLAARLSSGADALAGYASVLEAAKAAAAELREQAAGILGSSLGGDPVQAAFATAALASVARAWANVLADVRLAAMETAATLCGLAADGGGEPGGAGLSAGDGGSGKKGTDRTEPLSSSDIARIRKEADGNRAWQHTDQGSIGDCYLLSTLEAYSQTPEGRQMMRDNVRWDQGKNAFVVTFYDHGRPVDVEVRDYYPDGEQGQPDILSVYERGYALYMAQSGHGVESGRANEAMEDISGRDAHRVTTHDGQWWPWSDDHEYTATQWDEIEDAVDSHRPVVAGTGQGDFSDKGSVTATTDTNDNGVIDDGDEQGTYSIADGHAYTVVDVDDTYVTLRNPWGHNDPADGYSTPPGDDEDGLIRITREEYEQHFQHTDIGS